MAKVFCHPFFSRLTVVLFACTAFGFGSCNKDDHGGVHVEYSPGLVERTSKEFLIPRELRGYIEKEYLAYVRKENPKVVLPDQEILERIPREFLNLEIRLRGSAPGVLRDHTKFSLYRGGGEIDLKDIVTGGKGSFYLNYTVERTNEPKYTVSGEHVYFLSETKKRKIDGESFGAGCQTFMDVTQLMKVAKDGDGLHLNATAQRYLPVIGGVFYFVDFNPQRKLYLAAVRVKDSRYPEQSCEN